VLAGRTPGALAEVFENPLDVLPWMDKIAADGAANGFDATDWLYQSWAYQNHDVGTTPGFRNTQEALASIRAQTLILAPPLDLFNPVQSALDAADGIAQVTQVEIPSLQGHQAASSLREEDVAFLNDEIGSFVHSIQAAP
jgi:homoserine O-acetyltransferase/O-succinyltransferase